MYYIYNINLWNAFVTRIGVLFVIFYGMIVIFFNRDFTVYQTDYFQKQKNLKTFPEN